MNADMIRSMAASVREAADDGDDERAHSREDDMHQAVLVFFAEQAPEPWRALAIEALKTLEIDFERWCA